MSANPNGSIAPIIQADSPGADKEGNWLPAPKGDIVLMLRMCWPEETVPSILDGTWKVPLVAQVP